MLRVVTGTVTELASRENRVFNINSFHSKPLTGTYCAVSLDCIFGLLASKSPGIFKNKDHKPIPDLVTKLLLLFFKWFGFAFYFFLNKRFSMFLISFSGAVLCAEETDLSAIPPCHSPDAVHSGSVLFGSLSPL